MKTIAKYLAIIIVISNTLFFSCVSKQKLNASTAHVEELKKDSIATHNELKKKLAYVEKKKVMSKTSSSKTILQPEHFTPLPPSKVDSVFKAHYHYSTEIVWTLHKPHTHSEAHYVHAYKVHFLLQGKKESAVYAEDGKLIEARSEILPDQLPEVVYEAIKKSYPEQHIVAASTYKSIHCEGSYVVVVKSETQGLEKELIVSERGIVVK